MTLGPQCLGPHCLLMGLGPQCPDLNVWDLNVRDLIVIAPSGIILIFFIKRSRLTANFDVLISNDLDHELNMLDHPKSKHVQIWSPCCTCTCPSAPSRIFPALMSRWMWPLLWRYSSPFRTSFRTVAIVTYIKSKKFSFNLQGKGNNASFRMGRGA